MTSPWRDVASQRAARAPALPTRNSTSTLTSMLTSPCAFDRSASHRALAASPSTPARTTCDSVLTSSRMSPLQRRAGSSLAQAWSTERRLRVARRCSSSTRSSARTTSAQLQTTTRATCVCCVTSTRTCSRFGATASRVLQHVGLNLLITCATRADCAFTFNTDSRRAGFYVGRSMSNVCFAVLVDGVNCRSQCRICSRMSASRAWVAWRRGECVGVACNKCSSSARFSSAPLKSRSRVHHCSPIELETV